MKYHYDRHGKIYRHEFSNKEEQRYWESVVFPENDGFVIEWFCENAAIQIKESAGFGQKRTEAFFEALRQRCLRGCDRINQDAIDDPKEMVYSKTKHDREFMAAVGLQPVFEKRYERELLRKLGLSKKK